MMKNRILVVGASGLVGGEIVRYCLEKGDEVHVLIRRELSIQHPNLNQIIVDFDNLKTEDIPSVDCAFVCLGTTIKKAKSKANFEKIDFHLIVDVATKIKSKGITSLGMISSVGADAKSSNFYLSVKGRTEEAIQKLDFPKLCIFRPGLLLGDRQEVRSGESMSQVIFGYWTQNLSFLLGKYTSIGASQLAKSMVNILKDKNSLPGVFHFDELKTYF